MNDKERSRLDLILDLLADEVAKRIQTRSEPKPAKPEPPQNIIPPSSANVAIPKLSSLPAAEPAPQPNPAMPTTSHAASLMARLALGILIVIILINIPFTAEGTALARSIPSSASLVIGNGLLVKEETSPDVYIYRDGAFHWITSLDAFDHYGFKWKDVHTVESGFLNQFEKRAPIYVLLKCDASPHIYRLEAGRKRWIVDIPTFQADGYVWQDVKIVACGYLRGLPDGDSIPLGRGTPPPPLP